jgi:fatty acid desaturase
MNARAAIITTRRSALRSGIAIARDWSVIILLVLVSKWFALWWVTLVCLLGIGLMQFALGEALLHEASHYNLFRRPRWNRWMGVFYAMPFFTTVEDWRKEHILHHTRFGTPDDHIVEFYAEQGLTRRSPRVGWVCFGKPLLGLVMFEYLRGLLDLNSLKGWLQIGAFWVAVVAFCCLLHAFSSLIFYWLLPLLAVYTTLLHWSEIADHYRTLSGTRSRIGWLHNRLWHNNGYHAVHHDFPSVPFYQLSTAHRSLQVKCPDIARGWLDVWHQISCTSDHPRDVRAEFWPEAAREIGPPVEVPGALPRDEPGRSTRSDFSR